MKKISIKNKIWFIVGLLICLLIRLIPTRTPNIEPILATQMPFAKKYGNLYGFFFGALSIIFYDLATGTIGLWTVITATTYGIVGVFAATFFKNRLGSRKNFIIFAIFGTIFYDTLTGLTIGPLLFHQPFIVAVIGQIPFTVLHLVGNIAFAIVLSPIINYLLIRKKTKQPIINLAPKYIS